MFLTTKKAAFVKNNNYNYYFNKGTFLDYGKKQTNAICIGGSVSTSHDVFFTDLFDILHFEFWFFSDYIFEVRDT